VPKLPTFTNESCPDHQRLALAAMGRLRQAANRPLSELVVVVVRFASLVEIIALFVVNILRETLGIAYPVTGGHPVPAVCNPGLRWDRLRAGVPNRRAASARRCSASTSNLRSRRCQAP
jgi:hypothetical protein